MVFATVSATPVKFKKSLSVSSSGHILILEAAVAGELRSLDLLASISREGRNEAFECRRADDTVVGNQQIRPWLCAAFGGVFSCCRTPLRGGLRLGGYDAIFHF